MDIRILSLRSRRQNRAWGGAEGGTPGIQPRNTVLRDLKANASGWMHNVFPDLKDFSWQRGYGAFTVSQSNVERVQDYIARQKEHHQKKSFRDEFIEFLEANGIEYNEEYL